VVAILLDQQGDVKITEGVVKAAAGNDESGLEVMALILERRGDQFNITEEVVKAAAANSGCGSEVMALLFMQRRDEVKVTKEVVRAAAGKSQSRNMAFVLEQRARRCDHRRGGPGSGREFLV